MVYTNDSNKITISISQGVLDKAILLCNMSKTRETGGIILGYYSLDLTRVVITELMKAPADSKSGRTWFIRGVKNLEKVIMKKWKNNEYYIGEWHFHPLGSSHPSSDDYKQLLMISKSKKFKCPEPIMLILSNHSDSYEASVTMCFNGRMIDFVRYKN